MKKKISLGLVLVIVCALLFATVALAVATNLFHFFGTRDERYEKVAGQANLEVNAPLAVEDDLLGTIDARFDSALYDGMTLNVALVIEHPEFVEVYTPDQGSLSAMEVMSEWPVFSVEDQAGEKAQAQAAMLAAMESGTPYGYRSIEYFPSDHITTDDGVDIPPFSGDSSVDANGRYMEMREFESPLPDELQNLDAITLNCAIWRHEQIWYFDGTALYHQSSREEAGVIRATVPKSDGMVKRMQASLETEAASLSVSAEISTMSAVVTIDAEGTLTFRELLGEGVTIPEDLDASDCWVDMAAYDEQGRRYRSTEGFDVNQALPVTQVFTGVGELPERLEIQIFIEWEGKEEDTEPFTIILEDENDS
ncbi:MAG: hypothetical protein Q4D04_15240 [Clostridia bacterium]|nr:hypothetical protein [Clostridia bacterium]